MNRVIAGLHPIEDHRVVGRGRARVAVVGGVGIPCGPLGKILGAPVGLHGGGIVAGTCRTEHWRGRQCPIPVMRQNGLAQIDRGIIDIGGTHDVQHVHTDGFIDIVSQADVAEVFDQDPALDIVCLDLANAAELVEKQGLQIGSERRGTGNIHLGGHRLGHAAVVDRVHGGNPAISDRHPGPIKVVFRPIYLSHFADRIR